MGKIWFVQGGKLIGGAEEIVDLIASEEIALNQTLNISDAFYPQLE